jgi:hypothetical protein
MDPFSLELDSMLAVDLRPSLSKHQLSVRPSVRFSAQQQIFLH